MKRTVITLSIAAQLVAFGAIAQTTDPTAPAMSSNGSTETFGSDWSSTLGSAIFGAEGTTLRPSSELSTQWATLSAEDKAMIERDCLAYTEHSGDSSSTTGATGSTGATGTTGTNGTGGGTDTTGMAGTTGTTGTTGAATSADGGTEITVSMEQMKEICTATQGM